MDAQAISLVRTTFKAVAAERNGPARLTASFYSILFTDYPEARDFFPAEMETQRDRLVRALAYVVDQLEHMDALLPYLAQLGRDHRKYGIDDDHYTAVGNSLLKALRNFAGTELWTEDVENAWSDAVGTIASAMTTAANTDRRPAYWGGTIIEHRRVLRNLAIVRLQLNEPMAFRPGQYMSVQIPSRPRMWRYMSPAAPANADNQVEFHVRSVTGGWVSPSMVRNSRVGEQWHIGAPVGALGMPKAYGRDLVMIGSGVGLAPMRAQILDMAERTTSRRVHLFVCGYRPCDLYELEMYAELAQANPWLTVTPVTARDDDPWWHFRPSGPKTSAMKYRLTGQFGKVIASFGDWADRDVQIAGPPAMVQTTKFRLMAGGTPSENIRHDPLF